MFRTRLVRAAIAVTLLISGWLLFDRRALAIQDSEDKVWFGPVTAGVGQGARIHVYAVGNPDIAGVPDERPWTFTIRIFNRRGEMAQEREFELARGAIGSLEIAIQDEVNFPADRLGRRTLRAEIVGFNPQPDPPGKYAATLEVYNRINGHTTLLLGGPDTLPPALIVNPSISSH